MAFRTLIDTRCPWSSAACSRCQADILLKTVDRLAFLGGGGVNIDSVNITSVLGALVAVGTGKDEVVEGIFTFVCEFSSTLFSGDESGCWRKCPLQGAFGRTAVMCSMRPRNGEGFFVNSGYINDFHDFSSRQTARLRGSHEEFHGSLGAKSY